jgi:hypothetical protein
MEEGKILHALRLGFFKEDVSAEAVCGYIRTFFPAPAIIRVSAAEQARFADAPTPNTREAGKVVEIGGARERAGAKANANSNAAPAVGSKSAAPAAKPATQPPPGKVGAPTLKTKATQQPQFHTGSPRFSKSVQRESSLQEKLKQAAEEIAATDTGIRRIKNNPSLLSRLVGRLKN